MGGGIQLTWQGEDFTLPARRQMEAIGRIEEHITRNALTRMLANDDPPVHKLASAWLEALRVAGAKTTLDAVYRALLEKPETDGLLAMPHVGVVLQLLKIMLLPKHYEDVKALLDRIAVGEDIDEPKEGERPLAVAGSD